MTGARTTTKLTDGWVSPRNPRPMRNDDRYPWVQQGRGLAVRVRLPMACLGEPLDPSGGCWFCAGTCHELLLAVGEYCPRKGVK